jgi:hypothetical protein
MVLARRGQGSAPITPICAILLVRIDGLGA